MATMNIKDPEVHRMAHRLAKLRHTSATGAVRSALEEALARELADHEARERRIEEIFRRADSITSPPLTDDDIYDERGLPK